MLIESERLNEQVLKEVKQIIAENTGMAASQIEPHHFLDSDLGCDSLDLVEITMDVEEAFDISVPDSQADATRTVTDIVTGVIKLLGRSDDG
jgi:acyl carrier protein